jgi:hypothetical protein
VGSCGLALEAIDLGSDVRDCLKSKRPLKPHLSAGS